MNEPQPGFLSRHKLAIVVTLLGLPMLICGGIASWWFARQSAAYQEVEEMRAEIRARGLPLDDQSLTEFRVRRMDDENSDAWMKVLQLVESDEFVKSCEGVPIVDASIDQESVGFESSTKVDEFLNRWSELRKEIHDITEGSGAIWTQIDIHGYATLLPMTQSSRSVSRLLALEHRDAIVRQDSDQAYHSLLAMIGAARSHEAEPLMICQLVHAAMLTMALERLKATIELGVLHEKQLSEILTQLRPLDDYGDGYRSAIIGERAMSQPMFDDLGEYGDYSEVPRLSAFGNRRIDALASLKLMAEAEGVQTDDLTEFFTEAEQISEQFDASFSQANILQRFDTLLTNLLTPAIGAYSKAIVRTTMQLRIAKVGIGLRLFQLRHGRWPASLDDLTPQNIGVDLGPIKPIGDQPFGYAVEDQTVQLWGFLPETPTDVTPKAPMDLGTLEEKERLTWEYWHWVLPMKSPPSS
jgi:hypothetical protein